MSCRMRGIGKGQTVTLVTPPEVAKLVKTELSLGRGVALEEQPDLRSGSDEQGLRDVVAWLLLNGMKSERTQANMLITQNTANVWKKRAYRRLMDLDDKALLDAGGQSGRLSRLLSAWREEMDSQVPNSVPLGGCLRGAIDKRILDMKNMGVLDNEEDQKAVNAILDAEFGGSKRKGSDGAESDTTVGPHVEDVLLEGEQVQEKEQEQVSVITHNFSEVINHLFSIYTYQSICRGAKLSIDIL